MNKDFDGWNREKKKTHAETPRLYTVREIWWCRLGINVGSEQDGRGTNFLRPAVILRGFGADACKIEKSRQRITLTTFHLLPLAGVRPKPTVQ